MPPITQRNLGESVPNYYSRTGYTGDSLGNVDTASTVSSVGSSTATADLPKITSTLADVNQSIATQKNDKQTASAAAASAPPQTQQQLDTAAGYHFPGGYGVDGNRTTASAPEKNTDLGALIDTPEPGMKWAWQSDGVRVPIPLSDSAAQYKLLENDPSPSAQMTQAGGIDTAIPLDDGNQAAKLGNGTYATLNGSGQFIKAMTQQEYENSKLASTAYTQQLTAKASSDFQSIKDQMTNGTIPLAPWQQDQINNMQTKYAQLIADQKKANASILGGRQVSNLLTGQGGSLLDSQGAVLQAGVSEGNITDALQTGAAKVSALTVELGAQISQMTHAYQSDNYAILKSAYDEYNSVLDKRQAEIDKMDTRLDDQKKAADANRVASDRLALDKTIADNTKTYQEKQQAIATSNASEQVRHDKAQELTAQEVAAHGKFSVITNPDGTQSVFNTQTGELTGQTPTNSVQGGQFNDNQGGGFSPGHTNIPILDTNTKQTQTGVWYIDGTNLIGKQADAAQMQAAKLGIPYMGKAQVAALEKLDSARQNIDAISTGVESLLASAGWRWDQRLENLIQAKTQIGPSSDALSSFGTWRSAAIGILQSLAGGQGSGLRINQAEIQMSVAQDIPKITDDVGTAKAKIIKVQTMLDNQERSMFGQKYDVMKAEGNSTSPTDSLKAIGAIKPSYAAQIQKIQATAKSLNIDVSDAQILSQFDPNLP